MTDIADQSLPAQGKFRRALASFGAFLEAMEYTSFDYSLDRIERLEREVRRLKEQTGQSRNPDSIDDLEANSSALER